MLEPVNISDFENYKEQNKYLVKSSDNIIKKFFRNLKSIFIVLFKMLLSLGLTVILVLSLILISFKMYISSLDDDTLLLDINTSKVATTSFIYVNDENGVPQEYDRIFNSENRIWLEFQDIPQYMKDAIISIEDKRFYNHKGVDWVRTSGAVLNLLKGTKGYGGSTLTQQLVKNITEDNKVSLTRKLREIFRAINLERNYSKDDILEAYLNIVNFGSGTRGIQAAANIYFNKNIQDCTIAECTAIASITKNPSAYNPIHNPENNRVRREIVLNEMLEQEKISPEEFQQAMAESENMKFEKIDNSKNKKSQEVNTVKNWYIETVLRDVINDLQNKYNIGKSAAEKILFTNGLNIYCAMDSKVQNMVEEVVKDANIMPKDSKIEIGYVIMDYEGRILATIGSREKKQGNLWYDRANIAKRQPGSTIKPIAVYAPAIDLGMYNYSSLIPDKPLLVDIDGSGNKKNWPDNWYKGYRGKVTLQWAIEKSANAPVAQVLNELSTKKSYEFLTQKLGIRNLDANDSMSMASLATGGTHLGLTVREMTGAFQIFGNGGKFFKPYTYYYVTNRNGKVILDNRNNIPIKAISSTTSTIMNRLLRNVIVGPEGTGRGANIDNWNIVGKTGTTNDDFDSWFIGCSPYAVAGIWTGYDNPKRIKDTTSAINIWKHIMTNYLKDKELKDYNYDSKVFENLYCKHSGKLATKGCPWTTTGYYAPNNVPEYCNIHPNYIEKKQVEDNNNSSNENDVEPNVNSDNVDSVAPDVVENIDDKILENE